MKKLTKKEREEIKMKLAYFDKIVKDTRELIKQGYTMPNLSGLMMHKQCVMNDYGSNGYRVVKAEFIGDLFESGRPMKKFVVYLEKKINK